MDHGGVIWVLQPTVWGWGNLTGVLCACLRHVCVLGQLILFMHLLQFQIRAVITHSFKMQKSDCVHWFNNLLSILNIAKIWSNCANLSRTLQFSENTNCILKFSTMHVLYPQFLATWCEIECVRGCSRYFAGHLDLKPEALTWTAPWPSLEIK